MLLDASDKLIFLTEPSKKTTVKCIINKYKRLKEYKNKNVSLHFIEKWIKECYEFRAYSWNTGI